MGRFMKVGRWSEPRLKVVCHARLTKKDVSDKSDDDDADDFFLSYDSLV